MTEKETREEFRLARDLANDLERSQQRAEAAEKALAEARDHLIAVALALSGCTAIPLGFDFSQLADQARGMKLAVLKAAGVERLRESLDCASAKLLMLASEICRDAKIDPVDSSDPRWTPSLADARRLRERAEAAEKALAEEKAYTQLLKNQRNAAEEQADKAETERDEQKARAQKAEDERDEWQAKALTRLDRIAALEKAEKALLACADHMGLDSDERTPEAIAEEVYGFVAGASAEASEVDRRGKRIAALKKAARDAMTRLEGWEGGDIGLAYDTLRAALDATQPATEKPEDWPEEFAHRSILPQRFHILR